MKAIAESYYHIVIASEVREYLDIMVETAGSILLVDYPTSRSLPFLACHGNADSSQIHLLYICSMHD